MPTKRLIVVDGHGMLYRAFYAVKGLTTSSGTPTNAVLGFIRMLRSLRRDLQPTHMLVVFDGGSSAERQEALPEYKAQRPPMPEDLSSQFGLTEEYLEKARIAAMCFDGTEADDVIASVTKLALDAGAEEILIVSTDKDFFQLVGAQVAIVRPSGSKERMGVQDVLEKTGVRPEQIVGWLALTGDTCDNIPGVRGVGAKTAAKLLQQYGDVEGVLENTEEISSSRIRLALSKSREDVMRNVELVRLKTGLVTSLDWELLAVQPEDPSRLLGFLEEYELHSLARDIREPSLL